MKTKLVCGCEIDLFFNWRGDKQHKIIRKCKRHRYNNIIYEKGKMENKEIEKIIEEKANKLYIELLKWLYDNYRHILREYEKEVLKTKLKVQFA